MSENTPTPVKVGKLETKVTHLQGRLERIEQKLDSISERLGRVGLAVVALATSGGGAAGYVLSLLTGGG